ncbi:hypothetical protein LNTAR_21720 [Lentisphaera araneosa HTCC2155]|uniref:Uncharacterized protein n=1 Tax=Lentisphaera araneosa HTCC2155 TaxID=313628 RepID=A6DM78_9BACT|nr:hypothetical protein [Lentisphaera araneosa]EDM27376.1 hypothetical protein LNTAR_21720 [Lentisphaera araneosa HTCC2155]
MKKILLSTITFLILQLSSYATTNSKYDLMKTPTYLLDKRFDYKKATVNGIKIGDEISKINSDNIKEDISDYIHMKDGSRYKIKDQTVVAIGLPPNVVKNLGINSEQKLFKIFGPHTDKRSNAVMIRYYFEKQHLNFFWNHRKSRNEHLFIGNKF